MSMGKKFENVDELKANGGNGDWAFILESEYQYIFVFLPVDKEPRALRLRAPGRPVEETPDMWDWDGNKEAPTLNPSILCRITGWHGYMRAGVLVEV